MIRAGIDSPSPDQLCDPLCFHVEGWINPGTQREDIEAVEIWCDGQRLGRTAFLSGQPAENPAQTRLGFQLLAHRAAGSTCAGELELYISSRDHPLALIAKSPVRFTARDYRAASFGNLLDPSTTGVWCRKNLNTSGPSQALGSAEVAGLLTRYLPPPPARVVDVGCGLGYYGKFLRAHGYDWLGVEIKASDCAELARQGLPHLHVDGRTLPISDRAFDSAICIEVLEHLDEPEKFLAEVSRVAPHRLLVSVPNAELVPYLAELLATPLHMLDSDHKNFFTRWSLATLLRKFYSDVEVFLHTRHPLDSREGLPLFNHLFAIATSRH